MPHYGDPRPTTTLIRALAAANSKSLLEVIVVDDGSPTPLSNLDGVTVIRRPSNGGFGAAVNTAAEVARGDALLILNSDLLPNETFVDDLLRAAQQWWPAVVSPQVWTPTHNGAITFRDPTVTNMVLQSVAVLGRFRQIPRVSALLGEDRPPTQASEDHLTYCVSGAAMLLPTEKFRAVGGFDTRFHMYMEELDLQRRLRRLGLKSVLVRDVVIEHVGFGSSDPAQRDSWRVDSWAVYARKWGSGTRRLRAGLTLAAATNFVSDSVRRVMGRDVKPVERWNHDRRLIRTIRTRQALRAE